VDHINGIHGDNRVENLRIMSYQDHGRIHPMIVNGEFNRLGTIAARIAALNKENANSF
jgi:hypothetical protein